MLEFLLMLPMLIGLTLILVRVNQAIQISVVNQQYARAHSLWMAFNSPVYPNLKLREGVLTAQKENQQIILVAGNQAPEKGTVTPIAATSYVARKPGLQSLNDGDKEASQRALVRIRDTVTLCTQSNVVRGKAGYVPVLPLGGAPGFAPTGAYGLGEDPGQFDFCHGNLQYAVDAQEGS